MMATKEIILAREALRRVNLEDLWDDSLDDVLVEWTGYPKPFACGHTSIYGSGPLDNPETNNRCGAGRRYQELTRVSQHFADGAVLFSWPVMSTTKPHYKSRFGLAVCVIETPDSKQIGLTAGLVGG